MKKLAPLYIFVLAFLPLFLWAQEKEAIDKIIARIDDQIILRSDLESLYNQMLRQGRIENEQNKKEDQCELLGFLITNKMLLAQANKDSIGISDEILKAEITARISHIDPEKRKEPKIRDLIEKYKSDLRDQLITQKMERILQGAVDLTPSEIKAYFKDIPADQMPYLEDQVEVAQLVMIKEENIALRREFGREISDEQAQNYLEKIRQAIIKEEISFEEASRLYSDDPYSRDNGGFFLNSEGGRRLFRQNLDSYIFFTLDTMQVGGISPPLNYRDDEGRPGYRIIFYKSNIPAHRARIDQDLDWLKILVLDDKRTQFMNKWFLENLENFYAELDPDYQYCSFWEKKSK